MPMRTVLFSIEKYSDIGNPGWGGPIHDYSILGSLASSNMGVVSEFRYDQFMKDNPDGDVDAALVKKCEETKPDMVMATHVIKMGEKKIKPKTSGQIRDELKVPGAFYWGSPRRTL